MAGNFAVANAEARHLTIEQMAGNFAVANAESARRGELICAGVWDEAGVFSASSCP